MTGNGYQSFEIGIALHFMTISHEMHFSAASSCVMTLRKHTYSVASGEYDSVRISWLTNEYKIG